MKRLLLPLLLAGCATVERAPPPTRAEAGLPAGFVLLDRERAALGTLADLLPRADRAFIELDRRALANAPTLAAAAARIDAARAGLRAARAERLPNIGASSTVSRDRTNPSAQFGGNLPPGVAINPDQTRFNAGVDASFDPDLFGRLRSSQRAAAARLDAAGADAAGVRLSLRTDIARAVVDARTLDAREAVVERDLRSASDLVAVTRVRSAAGIAPEFDLVRARSLEADALARLQPIRADRAAVVGRLVTLAALPAHEVQSLLAAPPAPNPTARPDLRIPSVLLSSSS